MSIFKGSGTSTWIVMNDVQIPFEDTKVLNLVLDFVDDLRPYGVILNGDIVDCYSISDFTKNPMSGADLTKEIVGAGRLMDRLAHAKERVWLGGNHEDRLRRISWKNVPAIASTGALDFEQVFQTTEHGFDYEPYGAFKMLGKLLVTHGDLVSKHSAYTAKMTFEKYGTSVLVGHTHRLGVFYRRDMHGVHAAYENGCLCKMTPEYAQQPNWQAGFSVVHVEPSGYFSVQQIPILDGSSFFYGSKRIGKVSK